MYRKPLLIAILVLALVSMACRITVEGPITQLKTGATQTDNISVPLPQEEPASVELDFAAGELDIAPGAEGALITGTAVYNVPDLKPIVTSNSGKATVKTGDLEFKGIPNFGDDVKNAWDLKLASGVPMDLKLNAGAFKGRIELGGLSLRSLEVGEGASENRIEFSEPNAIEMETLSYTTGASNVELVGLANANFRRMDFRSGAGSYTLDFSGDLQRDATVDIETAVSSLTIIMPEGTSARVLVDGVISNVDIDRNWDKSGSTYTMEGSGPTLTINVNMGAGSLNLQTQ